MKASSIALLLSIAVLAGGCATKETKSEPAPPVSTVTPPPDQPIAQSTDCQPTKNTKTTSKGKKGSKPAAADCPAPVKATPAPAPVAEAPAAKSGKPSEPGKPRMMKSRDGTFEGEVYGNIPAGSKWSRLIIGMDQTEVERTVDERLGSLWRRGRAVGVAEVHEPQADGADLEGAEGARGKGAHSMSRSAGWSKKRRAMSSSTVITGMASGCTMPTATGAAIRNRRSPQL